MLPSSVSLHSAFAHPRGLLVLRGGTRGFCNGLGSLCLAFAQSQSQSRHTRERENGGGGGGDFFLGGGSKPSQELPDEAPRGRNDGEGHAEDLCLDLVHGKGRVGDDLGVIHVSGKVLEHRHGIGQVPADIPVLGGAIYKLLDQEEVTGDALHGPD